MTNERVWEIALRQPAIDCNCKPEDFLSQKSIVVPSIAHPGARKYLPLPFECNMTSYGSCIVAQTSPRLAEVARKYIDSYPVAHCFETPNLLVLSDALKPHGLNICFMADCHL